MRKSIACLICFAVTGCGALIPNPPPPARKPVAQDVGTSLGTPKTAMIGMQGGTLVSDDGRVTLTVPSGAVAADTMFGIEPITNSAQLGAGHAYRLTPEGTKFTTAATVTFTYADADLIGSSSDGLSVGYQSTDGFWHAMQTVTVDTAAKTVSTKTVHLSDWSMLNGWQLRPPNGTVAPLGTVSLTLALCEPDSYDMGEGDELSGLVPNCTGGDPTLPPLVSVQGWFVNGGSGSLGEGTIDGQGVFGTYTAPGAAPPNNPIAVSVQFNSPGKAKQLAVSNITVGDSAWTGTVSWTMMSGGTPMVTMTGTTGNSSSDTITTTESSSGTFTVTSADPSVDNSLTTWTVDDVTAMYQLTRDDLTETINGTPCVIDTKNTTHQVASGTWTKVDAGGPSFSGLTTSTDPPNSFHLYLVVNFPAAMGTTDAKMMQTLTGNCGSQMPAAPTDHVSDTNTGTPATRFDFIVLPDSAHPSAMSGTTQTMDSEGRKYTVTWNFVRS